MCLPACREPKRKYALNGTGWVVRLSFHKARRYGGRPHRVAPTFGSCVLSQPPILFWFSEVCRRERTYVPARLSGTKTVIYSEWNRWDRSSPVGGDSLLACQLCPLRSARIPWELPWPAVPDTVVSGCYCSVFSLSDEPNVATRRE